MNALFAAALLIGIALALLFIRLAALERRLDRLSRLDAKIDALLKHAGLAYDEYGDVPPGVRDALERGKTILAVRRFREATGADLKDAKDFVDEVRRRSLTH
jgi:hypothetical protein